MKHKRIALFLAAVMLLLLCSCGGSAESVSKAAFPMAEASAPMAMLKDSVAAETPREIVTVTAGGMGNSSGSVYQRSDAKLIRRCTMTIQTAEFDETVNALYQLVERLGGYFEQSSLYGGSYQNANARRSGSYVIRIPAEHYDGFRVDAGGLGYVTHSSESTEDIGEQYYDTEARLKTLRTKQERLLSLLEQAETMEDIITLESALSDVEYEIEGYSSTLNRYDGLVSYATFTLDLQEVIRVDETTGQADTLADRMKHGFTSGFESLVDGGEDLLVWISYHLFSILILVAVAGGVGLAVKKKLTGLRRGKKKSSANGEDA